MDNNEKQIKYVDLNGLRHFTVQLKSYLKNHVMEYGIFQELLNEIQNRTFYKVVTSYEELLNESPKKNIIYLVPDNLGNFLEYIWIEDGKEYEQLGSFTPELKLDDYLRKEDSPFEKGEAENSAVLKGGNNQVTNANEVAFGKYNKSNSDTCFSIGIGTSDTDRKNAHEITNDGKHYIKDVGDYDGTNSDDSKDLATVINESLSSSKIKFTNPVGPHCPDPCFWKADDGYFYVKGTGRVATVLRTRNFVDYEDTGRTFLSESALEWINNNYAHYYSGTNAIIVPHCWAPFVIKIGNNWVLYMAVVEKIEVEKGIVEDGAAHIVAFTSKTPYGDFTNPVTVVSDGDFKLTNSVYWNNVIDPFVYCNPEDQKLYLVAGSSYSIGRVELSNDGLSTVLEKKVGNKCVRMAGLTVSSDPNRELVYEGAYIYSRPYDGRMYHYLFASKGHYAKDNYGLIVGRCENLNAIPGNPDAWNDKQGTSLITKINNPERRVILRGSARYNDKPWGPGHCAGIFETADGKTWMLYHCHTGDGINDRQLFIQEVLWDNEGWPYFKGGSIVESGQILNHIITDTPKIENNTLETRIQQLEDIISQITEQE